MNWYSKLHKERSCDCACLAMDIGNWWNSGRRSFRVNQRYMESEFDELAASNFSIAESSKPRWRLFWRKFKKEKKRLFFSPVPVQVPYDPYTYSQNFDQGIAWTEPDNLPRSFSARYADPSRLFQRNISVGCGDPNIMFLTLLNGSHIPTVIGGVGGAPQLWIEGTIDVKLGDLTKHKVAMSEAPPQLALMYENTKLLAPGRDGYSENSCYMALSALGCKEDFVLSDIKPHQCQEHSHESRVQGNLTPRNNRRQRRDVNCKNIVDEPEGYNSTSPCFLQPDTKVRTDGNEDQPGGKASNLSSALIDVKLDSTENLDPHLQDFCF
ncbi:hypothetical protein IFM89_032269 [Coptis chinensis]|uniref:Uncharacterized protein n=1 Tax=Coptis chinensis TaxID=261450 RepID=A0A835M2M4_9MAGN|nr:hypothetical protein IFM89_032269 [Coptis chinensis]